MKRMLFYESDTGRLVHAHYEVRVEEGDDESGPRLSAPFVTRPDVVLAELVTRGLDAKRLSNLVTDVAPQSSRRTERTVDPATGELRTRRLESGSTASRRGRAGPDAVDDTDNGIETED